MVNSVVIKKEIQKHHVHSVKYKIGFAWRLTEDSTAPNYKTRLLKSETTTSALCSRKHENVINK